MIYQTAISKSWVIRKLCLIVLKIQEEHAQLPEPKGSTKAYHLIPMLREYHFCIWQCSRVAWMRIIVLHFQLCQLRMLTAAAHHHVTQLSQHDALPQSASGPRKDFTQASSAHTYQQVNLIAQCGTAEVGHWSSQI